MMETNQAGYEGTAAGGTEARPGGKIPALGQDSRSSAKAALDAIKDAIEAGDYVKAGMMELMRNKVLDRDGGSLTETHYFGSYEDVTTLTNEELGSIYKDRKRFEETGKHEYSFDIAQVYRARHGYTADKDGNAVPFDPDADYSAWIEKAESLSDDKAAAGFEKIRNAKIETLDLDEAKTDLYGKFSEFMETMDGAKQAEEKGKRIAAYRRLEDSLDSEGGLDVSAYGEPEEKSGLGAVIDGIGDKIQDIAEGIRDFFTPDEEAMEKVREHQRQVGTGGLLTDSELFPEFSSDEVSDFDATPYLSGPFTTPDWRSFNGAPDGAKADGVSDEKPRYAGADVSGIKSRDAGKGLQLE